MPVIFPGLTFPDLASPPSGTMLGTLGPQNVGSGGTPYAGLNVEGLIQFDNYFGGHANATFSFVQAIDPAPDQWSAQFGYVEFYPAADVSNLYGFTFETDVIGAHAVGGLDVWTVRADNDGGASITTLNLMRFRPNISTGVTTLRGIYIEDMASSGATTIQPFNYADKFVVTGTGALISASTVTATDFIVSGSRFKSDTTDAHTGGLAVYDVNAAAYRDFLVWTNANAPSVVMSIPTTGTLSIDASALTVNSVAVLTSVTAHNVLSTTHGDTLADTVVRGDLLYGNSTPKWARLAKPSVLSGLSHDGTDVSWVTATGTGAPVRAAGATLTTPTLGVATATSLNGNIFTTGTYTLTGVAGKTLTFNKSLTLDGTDSTTMTFPTTSATIARTDAAQTFTGVQAFTAPTIATGTVITEAVGTSALVLTGATQTSNFPALNITQTWNNSSTTFKAVSVAVTVTNAAGASRIIDLLNGSTTKFSVDAFGNVLSASQYAIGTNTFLAGTNGLTTGASNYVGWFSGSGAAIDTFLYRDGANIIAQRSTSTAQKLRVYNTFTTVETAGEWFAIDWATTANVCNLQAVKGSSTGTARVLTLSYGGTQASPVAAISIPITSGNITLGGGITLPGGATFLTTNTALTDGAGGSVGTLATAPAAGNPTKWIGINDNGTTRYIPAW